MKTVKKYSPKTKILSLVLSFLIIFYLIPTSVFAEILDENAAVLEDSSSVNEENATYTPEIYEVTELREENVKHFLENMGVLQPVVAGLVGMIPNCAASVLITELYAEGAIKFGTAIAGLCTGAGIGLAVLFRANKNIKENLVITAIVYGVGVLSGIVINLF